MSISDLNQVKETTTTGGIVSTKYKQTHPFAQPYRDPTKTHHEIPMWQIGKRNPDIIAGQFAPKSKYSQRCGDWKKGGEQ